MQNLQGGQQPGGPGKSSSSDPKAACWQKSLFLFLRTSGFFC